MTVLFYFVIGILLAFLFFFMNKIIQKYENKQWIYMIDWLKFDEEGLPFVCAMIIFAWPLGIMFGAICIIAIILMLVLCLLSTAISKIFNWISDKIIK